MPSKSSRPALFNPGIPLDVGDEPDLSDLNSTSGVRAVACPSLPDVTCPFCRATDLGFLMGKVSFSATISGDDLFESEAQPLIAVVCSESHFFFLREKDLAAKKPSATA